MIEAQPCSSQSMSCGSQICQSRGLAHLPAQLPAATARLSVKTSFIRNSKSPQICWSSRKFHQLEDRWTAPETSRSISKPQDSPSVYCLIYAPPAEWMGVGLNFAGGKKKTMEWNHRSSESAVLVYLLHFWP